MSTIANSTAGATVFGTNGAAITSQPNNKKTTAMGGVFTSDTANVRSAANPGIEKVTIGRDLFGYLLWAPVARNGTLDDFTAEGDGTLTVETSGNSFTSVNVGDYVVTNQGYFTRVVAKASDSSISLDGSSTNIMQDAAILFNRVTNDVFDRGAELNNFIGTFMGDKIGLGIVNNDALQGGATTPNRDVNTRETVKTVRTATAIRAGNWNEYTGDWDTDPAVGNDTSATSIQSDNASSGPGRLTYGSGGTPTNVDY